MAAYVAAYVHLLPEMRGAYVPMCFFGKLPPGGPGHGQIGQIGQNILTLSPPTDGFF